MELKEIKAVIDLMTRNQLTEFELEKDNFKIKIKKGAGDAPTVTLPSYAPQNPQPLLPQTSTPIHPTAPLPIANTLPTINSPMVGTFYRSSAPESQPFVDVGATVNENTVVCIIEAMKIMNEIKAEMNGVVEAVLAENGKPVEFGQPLYRIRPA